MNLCLCASCDRNGRGSNHHVMRRVGLPLIDAFVAYDDGQFELAVDRLLPVRYEIMEGMIAGSRAQVIKYILC